MEIEITKMTSKGQVVIPQDIRDHIGLEKGERFMVYGDEDRVILKRIKTMDQSKGLDEFERAFVTAWKIAKENGITRQDVEAEIQAHRNAMRHR